MSDKFPRKYKRVPELGEIDPNDVVAVQKAREQAARDRAIDFEEVKLLRERMIWCRRREEVNAAQRCREVTEEYMTAYRRCKSKGWYGLHYTNPQPETKDTDTT